MIVVIIVSILDASILFYVVNFNHGHKSQIQFNHNIPTECSV